MTPTVADLIITGCTVLVHDDQERIGFREDAAIVVRDGAVEAVKGAAEVVDRPAVERLDARGQVALPGLVNCHTHAPMVALRGVAEDLPTEEWFNDVVWPIESNLTEKDVELGARLACAEMIRAGVTCFADHYFSMEAVAAVVDECGMRAHLGEAFFSSQGPQGRERSLEFALSRRGGRITTALAPHAPYTVTDADLTVTAELAREHGLPVHLHASENRDQTEASLARHGVTPIGVLQRTGILDTDVLIAHGTGILDRDLPVLQNASGRTAVATAPAATSSSAGPPPHRCAPCARSASPSDSPRTAPPPTTPWTSGSRWPSPRSSRSRRRAIPAG